MINKIPFITIITPTYNRADLIGYAIDSIINQKKTIPFDREMIIVDDGSTDDTRELVQKYIKKYPRNIFYFYQKNSGIPGVGRNTALDHMNKKSDYVIFLDSDDELVCDCIYTCLKKWEELKKRGEYGNVFSLSYFCKNQYGNLVGNRDFFAGKREKKYTYKMYLSNFVSFELHSIIKSSVFLLSPDFRFSSDVITEAILWGKIFKFFYEKGADVLLLNYIGRIYRVESGSNQITKSINKERFLMNAIGNERIISIIGDDLLKFGYKKSYAEYLFRIGINRILYGEKKKGLIYLKKSLNSFFIIKFFLIYLLSLISRRLVLFFYKIYI